MEVQCVAWSLYHGTQLSIFKGKNIGEQWVIAVFCHTACNYKDHNLAVWHLTSVMLKAVYWRNYGEFVVLVKNCLSDDILYSVIIMCATWQDLVVGDVTEPVLTTSSST